MRLLRCLPLFAALVLTAPVFAADSLMTAAQAKFKPIPTVPPALQGNPASPAKVELGKMLYFDPRLSASHAISCNSCHNVGLGGVDALETSLGHRWQRGGRNAPTVLNAVFNKAQFWDGRAKDLEEQAGGPMVNPIEMASPQEHVSATSSSATAWSRATWLRSALSGEPNSREEHEHAGQTNRARRMAEGRVTGRTTPQRAGPSLLTRLTTV